MTISYLLYTAILIAIFYCLYFLLIRNETFFRTNRYLLLLGIICSFIIPTIPTPVKVTVADIQIESKPLLASEFTVIDDVSSQTISVAAEESPIKNYQPVKINTDRSTSHVKLLPLFYLIGLSILLLNILIQLLKIVYTILKYGQGNSIIKLPYESSPHSFFKYIFIGKHHYNDEAVKQVLLHEEIHSTDRHTIDIIIAELLVIIQWFNPFAWLYRRSVERNLEFIVDNKMVHAVKSKKQYQYNIVNLAVKNFPLSVVTNYNQSLIKTRIKMMNTKRSSLRQSWKYVLFIPVICFTIFLFNPTKIKSFTSKQNPIENIMVVISASASQDDLIRVRSKLERINRNISFEGTEWDDRNYLRTYASSLSSAQGSVGQHIDYTDINRHLPVVMYNFKESTGGLVSEGELSTDLLLKCIEGSCGGGMENMEDELLVISSFTNDILSYKDFTTSEEFETEQRKFDNERNWSKLFYQDLDNGTNSFTYIFDGKKMSVSDIKEQYKLRDVRDVSVIQKESGKDVCMIKSSPYKGFQSHQTSFRHLSKRTTFATFMENSKEEIVATKKTYPDSQIKYFYEGLEDEDIMETIDSSHFKFMAIETGNNFTNLGDFLGHEIRVHFNKD